MKRLTILVLALLLSIPLVCSADDTVYGTSQITLDGNRDPSGTRTPFFKVYYWTVTSAGEVGSGTTKTLSGFITQVKVSGSSNYEVQMQDEEGLDRFGGYGDVTTTPALITQADFGYYPIFANESAFPVLKWTSNAPGEVAGVTVFMVP